MRLIASFLTLASLMAGPLQAAEVHLASVFGTKGCTTSLVANDAEDALKGFQKTLPGTVVTNRAMIGPSRLRVISVDLGGDQPAMLIEGSRVECESILSSVRKSIASPAVERTPPVPPAPDRVVKGWAGDRGWQWTDAAMRKYDKRWRALNLSSPVDCSPLSLESARLYERGFVGQVVHLEEDGVPLVFMVREKVQITFMPVDLATCERKALKIQASTF